MATIAPFLPATFKSIQWSKPGTPAEALSFHSDTPLYKVTGSNILIKVHAAALNPVDWKLMHGGLPNLIMPSTKIPGMDVAGTIVALGPKAGKRAPHGSEDNQPFVLGDEVMAMLDFSKAGSGALQEYSLVEEKLLVRKPARWSFEQAAAWPLVAETVWQALVIRGQIKKGDKVLINGASGGTGTVGVQLAKALGGYVVGVCSAANVELVKKLGADEVVDYNTTKVHEKYTQQDFDIIFDTVGSAEELWANNKTLLKPTGNLIRIAGDDKALSSPINLLLEGYSIGTKKVFSALTFGPGYHLFTTFADGDVLSKVIKVLDEQQAVPVIDSVKDFSLASVQEAFIKSMSKRSQGKLVIRIA